MKKIIYILVLFVGFIGYSQTINLGGKTTSERDAYSVNVGKAKIIYNEETGQLEYKLGNASWAVIGSGGSSYTFTSPLQESGGTVSLDFIDDDTMATATATNVPSSESLVAYVAAQITANGSPFTGFVGPSNDFRYAPNNLFFNELAIKNKTQPLNSSTTSILMQSVEDPNDLGNYYGLLGFSVASTTGSDRITNNPSSFSVLGHQNNVRIGGSPFGAAPTDKLEVVGTVNATAFVGDGSGLTNLPVGGGGNYQENMNIVVATENGVVTGGSDQKANIEALIADNTEIFLPDGIYNLSGKIDIGAVTNFRIVGNKGARLVSSSEMVIHQTGAWDNVELIGFSVESTNTTTTTSGGQYAFVYIDNQQADDVLLKDLYLTGSGVSSNAIKIRQEGATTANNVTIDGIIAENIGRMGFEYQNHVSVSGSDVSRASNVTIKNSRFVNPGQQEFSMGVSFSGPLEGLKLLNNHFEGCTNRAMEFLATQGAEIIGNYGENNNDFFVFTNNGVVSALPNRNIVFSSNTSKGLGTGGTDAKDDGTFRDVQGLVLVANEFNDTTGGMVLDNTTDVYGYGNIIDTHAYGALTVQGTCSNINFMGGRFKNTKTGNGLLRINADVPQFTLTDTDLFAADAVQLHVRFGGGATVGPKLINVDEYHGTTYATTHNDTTLDDLSNVSEVALANGEVLKWNGTSWSNEKQSASDVEFDDLQAGEYSFSNVQDAVSNLETLTANRLPFHPESANTSATLFIGTEAQRDAATISADDVVLCSDCPPAETETGTVLDMGGYFQRDDRTTDTATWTVTNSKDGGLYEILIDMATAPTVTGATQIPNTADFAANTEMVLTVKNVKGTLRYFFTEW